MEDFHRIYENRCHCASGFGNWTSREDKNCGDYDSDGLSGFDSYEDNDFLHNLHYNLRRNLRHAKTFFKKYIHAGIIVNTALPACHIYYFTLQIHKSSAQN